MVTGGDCEVISLQGSYGEIYGIDSSPASPDLGFSSYGGRRKAIELNVSLMPSVATPETLH